MKRLILLACECLIAGMCLMCAIYWMLERHYLYMLLMFTNFLLLAYYATCHIIDIGEELEKNREPQSDKEGAK